MNNMDPAELAMLKKIDTQSAVNFEGRTTTMSINPYTTKPNSKYLQDTKSVSFAPTTSFGITTNSDLSNN